MFIFVNEIKLGINLKTIVFHEMNYFSSVVIGWAFTVA